MSLERRHRLAFVRNRGFGENSCVQRLPLVLWNKRGHRPSHLGRTVIRAFALEYAKHTNGFESSPIEENKLFFAFPCNPHFEASSILAATSTPLNYARSSKTIHVFGTRTLSRRHSRYTVSRRQLVLLHRVSRIYSMQSWCSCMNQVSINGTTLQQWPHHCKDEGGNQQKRGVIRHPPHATHSGRNPFVYISS